MTGAQKTARSCGHLHSKPDRSLSISSGVVMGFIFRCLFRGIALVSFLISTAPCYAQLQAGSISGVVTDATGAVIATASIHAVGIDGTPRNTTAGSDGKYALKGLAPGQYQLQVEAPGFETYLTKLELSAGLAVRHDAQLLVAVLKHEVSVVSAAPLDLEPTNNASAIILQGSKLEALSDDPDDFAEDIQALSGPAAGPDGGEIFIDGFSGESCRRSRRFARYVSTRIRSHPSTTSSASAESRSSPSRDLTSFAERLYSITAMQSSTPKTRSRQVNPTIQGE